MVDRHEKLYWIIPITALIIGTMMGVVAIEYKINTILPNAEIELYEIKSMSCTEITARNSIGSYQIPDNRSFADKKVDTCSEAKKTYKSDLKDILNKGTDQNKKDAGFTKLWFGVWDHPDLRFISINGEIVIPANPELFVKNTIVIKGYNNTVNFQNKDDTTHIIQDMKSRWSTIILPDETASVTLDKYGVHEYFSKPGQQAEITVFPSGNIMRENFGKESVVIIPKGAVIEGDIVLIPQEITVVLGINNTVTWINEDSVVHGIASYYSPSRGLSVLEPGESFSITFNEPGIFPYHGEPHPWMTGTVTVLE